MILAIISIVTLLTSIVPVYLTGKFDIYRFMAGGQVVRRKGGTLYRILSVFQATVSVILIICLITIYKQLSYVKHTDIGFDREHLIRLNLPGNFEKGDILKQEFSRLPFVRSATLSLGVPGMINSRAGSGEPDNQFWFNCIEVDEDFIPTFGLRILAGRNFRNDDRDTICIINEAALKQYGWEDIENKKFRNYGLDIVGVVNDFHISSFHDKIEPAVLIFKNRFRNVLSLRLTPGNTSDQIASLNETWIRLMPDNKFDFVFYDDFFNSLYKKEEKEASAITIFSVLALIITLMGMIGLIFQSCLRRSKEIGIRKINGASVLSVMMILNRELILMTGVAFIIAVPVSWYAMVRWLQNFAYRTELSWWIPVAGGLIVLGISAITLSWQSWRAATRNPVEALRYE
jgi:putative ABC transport system permease protein